MLFGGGKPLDEYTGIARRNDQHPIPDTFTIENGCDMIRLKHDLHAASPVRVPTPIGPPCDVMKTTKISSSLFMIPATACTAAAKFVRLATGGARKRIAMVHKPHRTPIHARAILFKDRQTAVQFLDKHILVRPACDANGIDIRRALALRQKLLHFSFDKMWLRQFDSRYIDWRRRDRRSKFGQLCVAPFPDVVRRLTCNRRQ